MWRHDVAQRTERCIESAGGLTAGAEPPGGTSSPHSPGTAAADPTNLASPLDSLVGSSDLLGPAKHLLTFPTRTQLTREIDAVSRLPLPAYLSIACNPHIRTLDLPCTPPTCIPPSFVPFANSRLVPQRLDYSIPQPHRQDNGCTPLPPARSRTVPT